MSKFKVKLKITLKLAIRMRENCKNLYMGVNRCCDFSETISMTSEVIFNVKVQGQTLNTIKTGNLNARKLHKYTFCEILEVTPLAPNHLSCFFIPQKVCLQTKSPIPYQPPTSKTKLCKKKVKNASLICKVYLQHITRRFCNYKGPLPANRHGQIHAESVWNPGF